MRLVRLSVENIRIHDKKTIDFRDNPTLITGPNGSGKTSLIEAIYVALRGKSFRGTDETICRQGADHYRILLETDQFTYRVQYGLVGARKTRQFIVDDKKYARLPYKLKYPIVLFEPEDLRTISGSPQRRRHFIDTFIQQYDPQYSRELSRYDRALQQRNKLLKQPNISPDMLFSWNVLLSDYGAAIIAKRQAVITECDRRITEVYRRISHNNDEITMTYSQHEPISSQQLLRHYEEKYDYDRITGATSIGPHRHDIIFSFNHHPAAKVASRCENRTMVLALKWIESDYIAEKTKLLPFFLLDDVFGELDLSRQASLIDLFNHTQTVIASVDGKKIT